MSAESTPEPGISGKIGTTAPRHRAAKGRRTSRDGHSRAALAVLWTAAGVLVLGGTGIGYLYFKLNENIKTVDINQALGTDRPLDVDNGSQDILVLGSDTRSGSNKKLGGGTDDGSARSDTAMIVHVYEGHKQAGVVSIPRDTLVDRPECTGANGKTHAGRLGRDVQLRVLHGGRDLCGEDRRVHDRYPHGPLHRGRLLAASRS